MTLTTLVLVVSLGAAIVAHERAREEAIAFGPPRELPFWDGPDWGDLHLDPPFVTFTDEITLPLFRPARS